MTEQELRKRLINMTYKEIPAETHRAFLSAISPGKEDEGIMKEKLSFSFVSVIAILLLLGAVAYAATEVYQLITINMKGEIVSDDMNVPQPTAEIETEDVFSTLTGDRLLELVPEGEIGIVLYSDPNDDNNNGAYGGTIKKTVNTWEDLQQAVAGADYITLPSYIPEGYELQYATVHYECKAGATFEPTGEKQEGSAILKTYKVEESEMIVEGYDLILRNHNDDSQVISITSFLSEVTNPENSTVGVVQANNAEAVVIPGIDYAVAITSEGSNMKSVLKIFQTLDSAIAYVRIPDLNTSHDLPYSSESITVWASVLDVDVLQKMFTVE